MVLRTKHAPSPSITFWRSRLVWSRARDWKSRNRQKRFKSSNLFFSATKIALGRVLFVLSREIRRHLCRWQHCCRTLRCTLRFECKHAHFAVGRISSSQTVLARVCREKGKANMRSMVGLPFGGRRPAEQRDVRCKATTYIFFSAISE